MISYTPKLKICGVANETDAQRVGRSGADYCGVLVEVGFSERSLSLEQADRVAAAAGIDVVILLCNPSLESARKVVERIRPFALQLLCQEPARRLAAIKSTLDCQVWKTVHLPAPRGQEPAQAYVDAGADALLVDSLDTSDGFVRMGGTGKVADWQAVRRLMDDVAIPIFLAGGIGPGNVASALNAVRPHGIDLCSGVEAAKGVKDPQKIGRLVANFKAAVQTIQGERP